MRPLDVLPVAAVVGMMGLVSIPSVSAQPRGGVLSVRLVNGTTGGPGTAEKATLFRLRDEMIPVEEIAGVSGSFEMTGFEVEGERPMLLQVTYRGVNYNVPVSFGRGYEADVEATVYDVVSEWNDGDLEVKIARVLYRREGDRLLVNEVYVVENRTSPPRTYYDPEGSFRFHLPTTELRALHSVSARGETGMPVPQQASPLPDGTGYVTKTAFKPGETKIDVSYEVGYAEGVYEMERRTFYPLREAYVFVAPPDIRVEASGWEDLGVEPEGRFAAFRRTNIEPGTTLEVTLRGGSDSVASSAGAGDSAGRASPTGTVSILPDRSHFSKAVVVVLMAAALVFGLLKTLYPARPSHRG